MDRAVRPILLIALSLGSFLLVAGWVRAAIPWVETDGMRAKMAAFSQHKDAFDAVFLGSSHVFHGFRPEVVDPLLSRDGAPFRSFNLGMEGMFSFEADALLREVLAMRPARLRWLVVEAPSWRPKLSKADAAVVTERNARWHTPGSTALALRSVALSPAPWPERLGLARAHLHLFGLWLGNYGQGPNVVRQWIDPEPPALRGRAERFLHSGGYEALETRQDEVVRLRQANLRSKAADYSARVAKLAAQLRSRGDRDKRLERYNYAALARQLRSAEAADARIVYVVMPALLTPRYFAELHREGAMPALVDLRDPDTFPELWALDNRFDEGHLTQQGAALLSRYFADRFSPLLEAKR